MCFIHLNLYNVMHSKTEIIFFTQEKSYKASQCMQKIHIYFFLLLLTASHSPWAPILLHIAIFEQIIFKREVTILVVAIIALQPDLTRTGNHFPYWDRNQTSSTTFLW